MDVHFFKEVPGYKDYFCSDKGLVRSKKSGKYVDLSIRTNLRGYSKVSMMPTGSYIGTDRLLHRVVAETWIPNHKSLPTVNHINGREKTNNRVENLEWTSHLGQVTHALETGLIKLNVSPVCQADSDGNLIAEFESIREAMTKLEYQKVRYQRLLPKILKVKPQKRREDFSGITRKILRVKRRTTPGVK